MSVKLLTEHNVEFLTLKGGLTGSSDSDLSKCHIVGNHMSRLKFNVCIKTMCLHLDIKSMSMHRSLKFDPYITSKP